MAKQTFVAQHKLRDGLDAMVSFRLSRQIITVEAFSPRVGQSGVSNRWFRSGMRTAVLGGSV